MSGMMVEDMKGNTQMTRNMGMEFISGLIKDNMKVTGIKANNMG